MCFQEGRLAIRRDLGILDKYERMQVNHLCDTETPSRTWRCFDFTYRLTRREEASISTLQNSKRMGPRKRSLMTGLAYTYLVPREWAIYKDKMDNLLGKSVDLHELFLKLPFGNLRGVQRAATACLRQAM